MIVIRDVAALPSDERPWAVALGGFDGVHLGHQAVLRRLTEVARQSSHAALVASIVRLDAPMLGGLRQRIQRIAACGVDVLCLVRSSLTPPSESIRAVATELSIKRAIGAVVLGSADRWCSDPLWSALAVRVESVPMVACEGAQVATDAVRAALVGGDLDRVRRLLGAPYAVGGHVVTGLRRGRSLGFPTANLHVRNVLLPRNGVYAVSVRIDAVVHRGVANLGLNPTFANTQRTLETHIFDFDGNLYGRYIEVTFVVFLRDERKFPSVDALVAQIRSDASAARRLLS